MCGVLRLLFNADRDYDVSVPMPIETRPLRSAVFVALALVHIAAEYTAQALAYTRRG